MPSQPGQSPLPPSPYRANQSFYQFIPPTDGLPYDSSTPDKEITARGGKPKGIRTPETVAAVKAATSRLRAAYMGRLVATSTAKDLVTQQHHLCTTTKRMCAHAWLLLLVL